MTECQLKFENSIYSPNALIFNVWPLTSIYLNTMKPMNKRLFSLGLSFLTITAFAQAPRTQLYEVFSGENCGPCASANPTTHALLTANPNAIIGLKYQVPIPSAGPIHLQNATESNGRRSYYGVNSAPNARHDGTTIGNGHSINLTQSLITSRSSTTSPFSIQLSHSFSSDWDSIFITMTVTAAQAVTSGTWKGHIALIEKNMLFTSPPGTNGETEFHNVMRKMYPNHNGTALNSTWTNGQEQTISIAAPVPSYIRDIAEVAVVGFVQDDVTKEVAQAKKTEPLPVPLYSSLAPPAIGFYNCTEQLTPAISIQNLGINAITTMVIEQKVNGNTSTINWTGNLASNSSTNVTLNAMTLNVGSNTVEYKIVSMNGQPHPSAVRSTSTQRLFLQTTRTNTVSQSFPTASFPPSGWAVDNGASTAGWSLGTPGANGTTRSAKMDFYNIPDGEIDYFYLPRIDLTGATGTSAINFMVAHAQYQTSNDALKLQISTDCGLNWVDAFNKAGATLATAPSSTAAFNSVAASQWRQESVDITNYNGNSNLLIRFEATSNFGNNLYIDEIALAASVSVDELSSVKEISLYPNPTHSEATIKLNTLVASNYTLEVRNQLGQLVLEPQSIQLQEGEHLLPLGIAELPAGLYFVNVKNNTEYQVIKLVKQ